MSRHGATWLQHLTIVAIDTELCTMPSPATRVRVYAACSAALARIMRVREVIV